MKKALFALLIIVFLSSACAQTPVKKPNLPETAQQQQNQPAPVPLDSNNVQKYANRFPGKLGLYAKNLKTGQTISINSDEIFATASTHKLVVALAVYKYIYPNVSVEKKKDYDQMIKKMMIISDNPSFYELLDEIEQRHPDALTKVLKDLNLTKTRIHSKEAFHRYGYHSVTTPQEMAVVFETIYNEQYLGKEMSAILKEELAKTIYKEEIPRHMGNNKVMHKVGQLPDGVLNDVGIVDDGKNLILISSFSKTQQSPDYASNFLAELSAKSYEALRNKN
ncbi:serine hydrolase [Dendrosporobacter sp. 1207_IL3150]|uniref:serine hydrolase n=1 Tax=Dendrosporobacter sp. 1207_IL3150 TaxID=3084054 RepID=UPI002FDB66C3